MIGRLRGTCPVSKSGADKENSPPSCRGDYLSEPVYEQVQL